MTDVTWEILARLLLAIAVGGVIGAERESRGKAAGFRTMTLICLGSALFTTFSATLTEEFGDPSRVAAQIVTGVGFLGAGTIMRDSTRVSGLTTAATIWITAALGMGIGSGEWGIALTAAGLTVLVLGLFPSIERVIDLRRESDTYTVTCGEGEVPRFDAVVAESGLKLIARRIGREQSTATLSWTLTGRHECHERLALALFGDPEVRTLRTGP
jgi:putative Mg2+ transporter-C (MgtC) family protein